MPQNPNVLISGASVAGPALAYWLARAGWTPTVVERAPTLRAGHAVDLFGPAYDVADWMGVLPDVLAARTSTHRMTMEREGRRPVEVDIARLVGGISDRHVEILRGDLAEILHAHTRDDVDYEFDNSIAALADDGAGVHVEFERGPARRFDLVIGADGLHSNVRRLAFGAEAGQLRWIGGYLCLFTVPDVYDLDHRSRTFAAVDRVVALDPVPGTGTCRVVMLFRTASELPYDHRDGAQQRALVRGVFAGQGWYVPQLLAQIDAAADFYFDTISQVVLDDWTRGRIALVGDAGYSPGPAVGGGTSIAMVGGYVLGTELARAGGDHTVAFPAYVAAMREFVGKSHGIGPSVMRSFVPRTPFQVWSSTQMIRLGASLPPAVARRLGGLQGGAAAALESITLRPPAGLVRQ